MSFPYFLHCGFTDEIEEITKTAASTSKDKKVVFKNKELAQILGGAATAGIGHGAVRSGRSRIGIPAMVLGALMGGRGVYTAAKRNRRKKKLVKTAMMMGPKPPMMGAGASMMPSQPRMPAPVQPGMSAPLPSYAKGGIVKYKKGGKIVRVAEKGDEAIIPLEDKKNAKRIAKKILKRR